jgi:hypothetical protein
VQDTYHTGGQTTHEFSHPDSSSNPAYLELDDLYSKFSHNDCGYDISSDDEGLVDAKECANGLSLIRRSQNPSINNIIEKDGKFLRKK